MRERTANEKTKKPLRGGGKDNAPKVTKKGAKSEALEARKGKKYCLVCFNPIVNPTKTQIYCSDACKSKGYRQRNGQELTKVQSYKRLKTAPPKYCKRCGERFHVSPRGRPAEYCSDSCRVRYCVERAQSAVGAMALYFPERGVYSPTTSAKMLIALGATYDPRGKFWTMGEKLL